MHVSSFLQTIVFVLSMLDFRGCKPHILGTVIHPYILFQPRYFWVFSILPWQDVNSYIPSKVSYGEAIGGSGQDEVFFVEVVCAHYTPED